MRHALLATLFGLLAATGTPAQTTGSVIFIHPDGTGTNAWAAARALYVGPDNDLHWDRLPAMALYRGHMADCLTATSNGGATTHAFGLRVASDAYGRSAGGERGEDLVDANGHSLSIASQALRVGLPVGLVQSGTSTEPGTGCFLAFVETRRDHEGIALQLVESGAQVMLGGGEQFYLPQGVEGVHGPGARTDGRNLIEEAQAAGYTVVRTRAELLSLPSGTTHVLGLFAHYHTFNDKPEEELAELGLPMYWPDAPTVAEMTQVALQVLEASGSRFLLVVEEEGTDNFGNNNNAAGMLEGLRRADEMIGVARAYVHKNPQTLILTAADSDAGGVRAIGFRLLPGREVPEILPATDRNGAPMDGVGGTETAPFYAAPDRNGVSFPFAITWAAYGDVSGAILVRAEGLNSHLVHGNIGNDELTNLMRLTLFGQANPD